MSNIFIYSNNMSVNKYIKIFDINSKHFRGNYSDIDNETSYDTHLFKQDCPNKSIKRGMFFGTYNAATLYGDIVTIYENKKKINLLDFSSDKVSNSIIYLNKLAIKDRFLAYCLQCMYGIYKDFNNFSRFNLSPEQITNEIISYFKKFKIFNIKAIEGILVTLLIPFGISIILTNIVDEYIIKVNKKFGKKKIIILFKFYMKDGQMRIYFEHHDKYSKLYIVENEILPSRISYLYFDRMIINKFNSKNRRIIYKKNKYQINGIYTDNTSKNQGICKIIMDIYKLLNIEQSGNSCIYNDYVIFTNTVQMITKYFIIKKFNDETDELDGYILQPLKECTEDGVHNLQLSNYTVYKTIEELFENMN